MRDDKRTEQPGWEDMQRALSRIWLQRVSSYYRHNVRDPHAWAMTAAVLRPAGSDQASSASMTGVR